MRLLRLLRLFRGHIGKKPQKPQKPHGQIKLAEEQMFSGARSPRQSQKRGQHGSGKTAPQVSPLRHRPSNHRRPLPEMRQRADAPGPDAAHGKATGPAGSECPVAGAEDVGQTMLMLLSPEGELAITCWLCKESIQDRRALWSHELNAHLSHLHQVRRQALGTVCRGVAQRSGPRPSPADTLDQEDLMTEDVNIEIHHAPGERPLCGAEGWTASYTDDPAQVAGCVDCLELVAEDL